MKERKRQTERERESESRAEIISKPSIHLGDLIWHIRSVAAEILDLIMRSAQTFRRLLWILREAIN